AVGQAVVAFSEWLTARVGRGGSWPLTVGVSTAAVLVLALLSNGAYVNRNADRLSLPYGDGPTVSTGEREAYAWLAENVRDGERVLNDSRDGSAWMYSFSGVEPMVFTFYGAPPRSSAE